ncbi:MAG: hypothetical protein IRZ13_16575 [Acetobacteraceae bacterium]|nr:hypothetical protein [Acetobacteraceae bacterium]
MVAPVEPGRRPIQGWWPSGGNATGDGVLSRADLRRLLDARLLRIEGGDKDRC